MNAKFKEPEFLSAFIDQYREMRNLWEVKHPQYYLKHVRKSTLERLLTFVQTYIPEATMEMLLSKIGILRNMYKREHNKIHNSLKSGASADDVYVPSTGTTINYVFLMTRLKPGHHFQPFPPPFHALFHAPFPPPQQRLIRTKLGLPSWKNWM
ncbi:hypothetical protein AB205_0109260 [Aquarana catesbeiana]|uniref:MADF domain-containing protein n=1 Tax=Aquarana catesbeiana TaxID=8400 RepID=A0A2G9QI18_AQUCT|nr:hypothetical protein AB205_0109260 [Aquarana catesbeiana]